MAKNDYCMYGMTAEFADSEALLEAAHKVREAGYTEVRAFSPYHVDGLSEALEEDYSFMYWIVIGAVILGAIIGFGGQWFLTVFGYEFNIGGRPLVTWPAFLPITFEMAVLTAGITAVGLLFVYTGLPLPYHPIFNTKNIETVTSSKFFLCIETKDKYFHLEKTRAFLETLEPLAISEVPC